MLAFVIAMSITMALIPLLTRMAGRMHVLDAPGPRKVHANPMPRVGGIAMAAGALVPLLYWLHPDPRLPAFLAAAVLLLFAGVWDDRADLGYLPKFGAQIAAAFVVMTWSDVLVHSITLSDRVELPGAIAVPLTILFLVGVTNAINLADGLDGLAGGTTLLSCCAMALLALTIGEPFVATVSVVVAGSILGFLRFNTYPARIFMGDGGSQFLGFTVAVLSVLLTQNASTAISAALPILLLGLPILDTLSVMAQRLAEGRSPFSADKKHIHHRLLELGFRHHEAVFVIYVAQGALFVAAWQLRYYSDLVIVLVFGLFAAVVLGLLHVAARQGWRWCAPPAGSPGMSRSLDRNEGWRRLRAALPQWALATAGGCVAIYALRVVGTASPIPADIGWLALALASFLLIVAVIARRRPMPAWPLQAGLYVAVVALVYLDVTAMRPLPMPVELAAVFLLAGSVMLAFRLTSVRRFELTTLDFLVVFVALALPNLPGSLATPREMGLGAVKLVLLFYAVELLLSQSSASRAALHSLGLVVLGAIGVRALY
jgi:UDP-GlcNAc:undecaprenyl-phosphate/decaprenyl-phosphate GlcNAc-1-phosphate transferase